MLLLSVAHDRNAVKALLADDALAESDVWTSCQISAFNLRVNEFEYA